MAAVTSIRLPSTLPKAARRGLIYFICGNPGCIGFYADFLEALRGMLDTSEATTAYDIYGRNLRGFADDEHEPFAPRGGGAPWDLDGQIAAVRADVAARAAADGPYDVVVLAGHSIGAYVAVDVLDRHLRDPTPGLRLAHGFLLFPTIASIALSPSGRRMQLLRRLPGLEALVPVAAGLLLRLVPARALRCLLETALGFSTRAADVATAWLKSRDGVRQALHLGLSELDNVGEDRWADELWEAATLGNDDDDDDEKKSPDGPPRFFFFYGRDDHWVADHVRDDFIRRRMDHGQRGGRTSIVVDEGNLPHAFCTTEHNSWAVAKRVHRWVREIEGHVEP